jgi:hypothetical protein
MTDGETMQMMKAMLEVNKCKTSEAMGQLKTLVQDQYKVLAEREANQMGWFVGQKVQMKTQHQDRKPYDAEGVVRKVNPKKLIVNFDGIATYTVPKTMLVSVI